MTTSRCLFDLMWGIPHLVHHLDPRSDVTHIISAQGESQQISLQHNMSSRPCGVLLTTLSSQLQFALPGHHLGPSQDDNTKSSSWLKPR
uniref:Uncharacterized protein n=1 Tax=Cannabis sativa TaxID=3483 RepID=A0A803NTU4_CANSA